MFNVSTGLRSHILGLAVNGNGVLFSWKDLDWSNSVPHQIQCLPTKGDVGQATTVTWCDYNSENNGPWCYRPSNTRFRNCNHLAESLRITVHHNTSNTQLYSVKQDLSGADVILLIDRVSVSLQAALFTFSTAAVPATSHLQNIIYNSLINSPFLNFLQNATSDEYHRIITIVLYHVRAMYSKISSSI